MNTQKGFSFIEVLVCLLLISTFALALLQEQWQGRQLLSQLILRAQASQFLDQFEEASLARQAKSWPTPPPYHLEVKHTNQELLIKLAWFEGLGCIIRKRSPISATLHLR